MVFREELIRRTELEVRVRKLKNENAAGKDEVTGAMDLEAVHYGL